MIDPKDIYVVHALYTTCVTPNVEGKQIVTTGVNVNMSAHYLYRQQPPETPFNELLGKLMVSESNDVGRVVDRLVDEHNFARLEGMNSVVIKIN